MNAGSCPEENCEEDCPKRSGLWRIYALLMFAVVVLFASAVYAFDGKFGAEKALTGLFLPVGLVWLNLTCATLLSWLRSATTLVRCLLTTAWLVVSLITTSPLPDFCFQFVEAPLEGEFQPDVDTPLDLLVVFGGGTQAGPHRAEVSAAGDRLVYAAQLLSQGHARKLLATGDETADQAVEIWTKLGISKELISTLPGKTTFEEIRNLKSVLDEESEQRIGILTSAYHMPRVQRLASSAGFQRLIPVAAHHLTSDRPYTARDFIPSLAPLTKFTDFQREMMGRLVGR